MKAIYLRDREGKQLLTMAIEEGISFEVRTFPEADAPVPIVRDGQFALRMVEAALEAVKDLQYDSNTSRIMRARELLRDALPTLRKLVRP